MIKTSPVEKRNYYDRLINFEPTEEEKKKASSNFGIVVTTLKHYKGFVPDEDLLQAGYLGLLRAVHQYNPSRGSFLNCCLCWIRLAMRLEIESSSRTVVIPLRVIHRLYKIQKVVRRLRNRFLREPTVSEIAFTMGLSEDAVNEALEIQNNTRSLNVSNESGEEEINSLIDPQSIPSNETLKEATELLSKALKRLNNRERDIVIQTVANGTTLEKIGQRYGITKERARQIKERALTSMKRYAGAAK